MRDPMSWSIPVFRMFGIPVRVHIFFIVVTLGLFFRELTLPWMRAVSWVDIFVLTVVVVFVVILLHELGHCFAARYVEGDAKEILIWPLGGLAYVDVPHTPRANAIATAGGPGMNLAICILCAAALAVAGFIPSLNPLNNPYRAEVTDFKGRSWTSHYGELRFYKAGSTEDATSEANAILNKTPQAEQAEALAKAGLTPSHIPGWAAWTYRVFWFSWILFLFNLIPAYPLDGGRLLQCVIWARSDHRRGVVVAGYSGFVVSVIFLFVSIVTNEALFMGLALFMMYAASMAIHQVDMEDGPFGYDFSAGYTSLEKDEEAPRKPKQAGWFTRWRQARRARKLQREADERQRDEERMDRLLEKIARSGKESLTEDERRFLERYSDRKRHMS